jgi:hypothetical protein
MVVINYDFIEVIKSTTFETPITKNCRGRIE